MTNHKKFGSCVFDFFQKRLEEQVALRSDPDLNNILLAYSPAVRSLSCEQKGPQLNVKIETLKNPRQIESQMVQFNHSGKVSMATLLPEKLDQIQFDGRSASVLRHCATSTDCKQYEMEMVKTESTYFWKDEKSNVSKRLVNKIPVNSFRWAKTNSDFLEMQSENIKNCCDSIKCRESLNESYRPQRFTRPAASRTGSVAVQR